MTHLEDEDIARLIDGMVGEAERKRMLDHMADCESCLSVYSETIKFLEEEGELKEVVELKPQNSGKLIPMRRRAWLSLAAALVFFLAGIYIIVDMLPTAGLTDTQAAFHQKRINEIWNPSGHHFSDPNNKEFAAVRIGIWMEDLGPLTKDKKRTELKAKYIEFLVEDLERFLPEGDPLLLEVAGLSKKTFRDVEVKARMKLDGFGMGKLYQFGRFIENILMTAVTEKLPAVEELALYLGIAKEHQLPQGVSRLLSGLSRAADPASMAEISEDVIEIFFE